MSDVVRVPCPGCRATLKVPAAFAGRSVKCKRCGTAVPVTADPAATGARVEQSPRPRPPVARPVHSPPAPAAPAPVAAPPAGYNPPPGVPGATPVFVPPAAPPAPVVYVPAALENVFAIDPEPLSPRARRKQSGGARPLVWVTVALLTAGGVTAGALYGQPLIEKARSLAGGDAPPVADPPPTPAGPPSGLAAAGQVFPRRMLVVSVTKYLYCNPLTAGNRQNPDLVTVAARRLAYQWRVPTDAANNQLVVLTDAGPKPTAFVGGILKEAVARFSAAARPQDRSAVYFGGHATFIDGKGYLVPSDGDLQDAASLLPLADFFKLVADGPAQEKLVVFDVCRVTPDGDRQRPGSEPMTADLEKALLAPPAGVRVVLTAAAGTNALEFRSPPASDMPEVGGSLFLSAVTHLAEKGRVKLDKEPTPADPLPVDAWVRAAQARMAEVAEEAKQPNPALKLAGAAAPTTAAVAPDPAAAPAGKVELPAPPAGLALADVAKLSARINALPPYRGKPGPDDAVDALVPFPAAAMANYKPDDVSDADIDADGGKTYPVRFAALRGLAVIRKEWRSSGTDESGLRNELSGSTGDALKKQILEEQKVPARIEDELDGALMRAEKVADKLADEKSKYWQVTYQYTLAQLKARLAFMREYNLALGNIRTDAIPTIDPAKGQAGLVLVSSEKMKSKSDVKKLAEEAAELFTQIADDHKGTPWAVQAKRHRVIALGLEWKPSVSGTGSRVE